MLTITDDGAVRTLTLDRPDRRNALGREMREALEAAVADTLVREELRVVVFRGAGPSFCGGADLKDPDVPDPDATWAVRRRTAGRWGRLMDAIEALPQVTVAALHGHVIGGGAVLACACDLRVAAPDAVVRIPELAIGIPLSWGGIPRLVREVGLPVARDLILTGRQLGAEEAHRLGLVQRVGDDLDALIGTVVAELLEMPTAPLQISTDALRAYGRTLVSHEAAWADPDLLDAARRDPSSTAAAAAYLERLASRPRD